MARERVAEQRYDRLRVDGERVGETAMSGRQGLAEMSVDELRSQWAAALSQIAMYRAQVGAIKAELSRRLYESSARGLDGEEERE